MTRNSALSAKGAAQRTKDLSKLMENPRSMPL
jgi:hypothetical protein